MANAGNVRETPGTKFKLRKISLILDIFLDEKELKIPSEAVALLNTVSLLTAKCITLPTQ